jgi:hypothetical protein
MTGKANNKKDIVDIIKKQKRDLKKSAGLARANASGVTVSGVISSPTSQVGGAGVISTGGGDLEMHTYDIKDVDRLYFSTTAGSADSLTSTDHGIESGTYYDPSTSTYTSYGINYRVPSTVGGIAHYFWVGSDFPLKIANERVQYKRPINLLSDTDSVGHLNGDIYFDGTDIKATVASGTVNLTSGGSWVGTAASDLNMASFDITSVDNISFINGTVTANTPNICSSDGSMLDLNFKTGSTINFRENGVSKHTWTSTLYTFPNAITSGTLTFNDSSTSPSTNGQIQRNGSDLKVYSGGSLKNFSDMLEQGLTNINFQYGQDITSTGSSLDYKIPSGDIHKFYISGTDTMEISVLGIGVEDGRYIQPIGSSDVIGIMPKQPTSTLSIGSRGTILLPNQASSSHPPTSSTLDSWFGTQSGACGLQYNSTQSAGTGRYRLWARHGTDWVRTEMS